MWEDLRIGILLAWRNWVAATDFRLVLFSCESRDSVMEIGRAFRIFRVRHLFRFLFLPALGNNLSTKIPCFFSNPYVSVCGNNMRCPEIQRIQRSTHFLQCPEIRRIQHCRYTYVQIVRIMNILSLSLIKEALSYWSILILASIREKINAYYWSPGFALSSCCGPVRHFVYSVC